MKVDLRAGNDTVQLVRNTAIMGIDIDVADQTGVAAADNDLVYIDGIRTDNQLTINTGRGTDAVQVWDSAIGNGFGNNDNLYVNTGVGADNVQVFTSTRSMVVRGSVYLTTYELNESDADTVRVQSLTAGGSLIVGTGAGNDRVDMTDVWAAGNVGVATGAGNDVVNLREVRAIHDIGVYMGDDQDTLTVQYLNADRVTLDGGAGYDTMNSSIPGHANVYSAVNFEPFWVIAVKLPGDLPLSGRGV